MQTCPIEQSGARAWLIVLDTDDEVHASLRDFDGQQRLRGARFRAIGAFPQAVLGYFDWECKTYERIPVAEQVEAVSLTGDVALKDHHPTCMSMPYSDNVTATPSVALCRKVQCVARWRSC